MQTYKVQELKYQKNWTDGWTLTKILGHRWATDRLAEGWTDGQNDGHADGRIDEWMDGWTDSKLEIRTETDGRTDIGSQKSGWNLESPNN